MSKSKDHWNSMEILSPKKKNELVFKKYIYTCIQNTLIYIYK